MFYKKFFILLHTANQFCNMRQGLALPHIFLLLSGLTKFQVEPVINRKALTDIILKNLCSLGKEPQNCQSKGALKFVREASTLQK